MSISSSGLIYTLNSPNQFKFFTFSVKNTILHYCFRNSVMVTKTKVAEGIKCRNWRLPTQTCSNLPSPPVKTYPFWQVKFKTSSPHSDFWPFLLASKTAYYCSGPKRMWDSGALVENSNTNQKCCSFACRNGL